VVTIFYEIGAHYLIGAEFFIGPVIFGVAASLLLIALYPAPAALVPPVIETTPPRAAATPKT
jgi:hypothetical protein